MLRKKEVHVTTVLEKHHAAMHILSEHGIRYTTRINRGAALDVLSSSRNHFIKNT